MNICLPSQINISYVFIVEIFAIETCIFCLEFPKKAQLANICAYGSVRYNMSNYLIDSILTSGAIIVCIQCHFSVEILFMYKAQYTIPREVKNS